MNTKNTKEKKLSKGSNSKLVPNRTLKASEPDKNKSSLSKKTRIIKNIDGGKTNQYVKEESKLIEHVVSVQKNSRTVKGGRIMSFSALVVVGDGNGSIGYSREKSLTVNEAVNKALAKARTRLFKVELGKGTILYPLYIEAGPTKIFLQQAAPGTGIVANHSLRCIFEALGVKNILSKVYGARTNKNILDACIKALSKVKSVKYFATKRGLTYQQMFYAANEIQLKAEPLEMQKEESKAEK